jgi:hypothetical protein
MPKDKKEYVKYKGSLITVKNFKEIHKKLVKAKATKKRVVKGGAPRVPGLRIVIARFHDFNYSDLVDSDKDYDNSVSRRAEILNEFGLDVYDTQKVLSEFFSDNYKNKDEILPYLNRLCEDNLIDEVIKKDVRIIIDNML